jgi:hypothetical protein
MSAAAPGRPQYGASLRESRSPYAAGEVSS